MFELNDVDVVAFLIDATKPIGRGDAWVAERVKNARSKKVLVLTKADEADPAQVMEQLKAAHELMEYDDEIVTSSVKNFTSMPSSRPLRTFCPRVRVGSPRHGYRRFR
mgnify:CR=1 FL=1